MLCEKCGKRQATTHIHTVINGEESEVNLCSYCAEDNSYNNIGNFGFINMFGTLFGDNLKSATINKSKKCDCCGFTFQEIADTGKVGCANCYKTFYHQLLPSIQRIHGNTRHEGKVPGHTNIKPKNISTNLNKLKIELNEAVKNEDYERAAQLRDEIRKLEGREDNE